MQSERQLDLYQKVLFRSEQDSPAASQIKHAK